jgi:hypothetical protein
MQKILFNILRDESMRSKSRIQFFEKQERKSSPLVPLQRGKDLTNQFIFGIAESIFEKLEKLFFSRSFRISPFGGVALSLSKME